MALEQLVVVWPEKETKNGAKQVQVTIEDSPGTQALRALLGIATGESFYVLYGGNNPKAPQFKIMRTVPDDGPSEEPWAGSDDVPF